MIIRGKHVFYTKHLFDRLYRVNDLDEINEILQTGKWIAFGKNLFRVSKEFRDRKLELIVKELHDRIKVITIRKRRK